MSTARCTALLLNALKLAIFARFQVPPPFKNLQYGFLRDPLFAFRLRLCLVNNVTTQIAARASGFES